MWIKQFLVLFLQAILQDLFPGVEIPEHDYGRLQVEIENVSLSRHLQVVPSQVSKVIQLYETMLVRHGVMLVGPTGSGKTTIYRVSKPVIFLLVCYINNKYGNARGGWQTEIDDDDLGMYFDPSSDFTRLIFVQYVMCFTLIYASFYLTVYSCLLVAVVCPTSVSLTVTFGPSIKTNVQGTLLEFLQISRSRMHLFQRSLKVCSTLCRL